MPPPFALLIANEREPRTARHAPAARPLRDQSLPIRRSPSKADRFGNDMVERLRSRVAVRRPLGRARCVRIVGRQRVSSARSGALRDRPDRNYPVRDLAPVLCSGRQVPGRRSLRRTPRRAHSRRRGAARDPAGDGRRGARCCHVRSTSSSRFCMGRSARTERSRAWPRSPASLMSARACSARPRRWTRMSPSG